MSWRRRGEALFGLALVGTVAFSGAAIAHPQQHGLDTGHLIGSGEFGVIEHLKTVRLTQTEDLIADVAVDPGGGYAYVANWGDPDCALNSESGGQNSPDAGAYVVDIEPIDEAQKVGFIPHSQDSRPGEGMQVIDLSTKSFDGQVLVMNNEQCGKNGKGGVTLVDVTDPNKPTKLSEHFGDKGFADSNEIHSAFAWDAGGRAFVVMTDNLETADVDILEITNPKRPRLIKELDLNAFSRSLADPIWQPELGLDDSGLHDMVVKRIDGDWVMLLSYWDGGYVQLNVNDPANPTFINDTDYQAVDPELADPANANVPADSRDIAPEGNGHQAEFTSNSEMFIGTDEDFSPFRPVFSITSNRLGNNAGEYPAGEFGWTVPIDTLPGKTLTGTTVFMGYGCPESGPLTPADAALPGVPDGQQIAVLSRGPVGDPDANYEACFFSQKVEAAQNAGYDGVIIGNHHTGAQNGEAGDARLCGSQGHVFTPTIPGLCLGHRGMHLLFGSTPSYDYSAGGEPAIGTVGEDISAITEFDGWGYVHLFDRQSAAELDTYGIDEAFDPAYALGFGDLSVHEVATDPEHPRRAYLAYYSGGIRAIDIVCTDPSDESTCELEEVGGYLDEDGNDFWGVEAFRRPDSQRTLILGSDRDSGLWIFRRNN
jgi:hypothetical protein